MSNTHSSNFIDQIKHVIIATLAALTIFVISAYSQAHADSPMWEPVQPYDKQYQSNDYLGDSLNGIDKRMMSQLLGAAIGGLIGSKIGDGKGRMAATAVGTLIGYMLAGKFMDYMDNSDRQNTHQALEYSKDHQTVTWQNPNTLADYEVTPVNAYRVNDQDCREYITRATIDGHSEEITGTACRKENGSWQVQN